MAETNNILSDAMKQPPMITYSLKDRGRKHRGQERDFNIKALCDSINGPATQEKIKTRAMLGYFGHKPRILFGMDAVESGVIAGKYNEIEPAIVTTYLEAFPDGTIKHQTEFLDSLPGKRAARMFSNRIGGFSSAIDQLKNEFYGFDYVLDPNFSTNRGFALDSANMTLDEVIAEAKSEEEDFWLALIAKKDAELEQVALALDHATTENEQLLSLLAVGTNCSNTVLDSTAIKPISISLDSVNRIKADTDLFKRTAKLPTFVETPNENNEQMQNYNDLLAKMGYKNV
jgi:hypothetical protein